MDRNGCLDQPPISPKSQASTFRKEAPQIDWALLPLCKKLPVEYLLCALRLSQGAQSCRSGGREAGREAADSQCGGKVGQGGGDAGTAVEAQGSSPTSLPQGDQPRLSC